MTNAEFCNTFAPCCSGDRNCGKFKVGDRITFDGGADVYSVRAYTGTVTRIPGDGAVYFRFDGYGNEGGTSIRKVRHLKVEPAPVGKTVEQRLRDDIDYWNCEALIAQEQGDEEQAKLHFEKANEAQRKLIDLRADNADH